MLFIQLWHLGVPSLGDSEVPLLRIFFFFFFWGGGGGGGFFIFIIGSFFKGSATAWVPSFSGVYLFGEFHHSDVSLFWD